MKNIIAVCDTEAEYAQKMMEYMNGKSSFFMKAEAFTKTESIEEYTRKNEIDCMLISESMFNEKLAASRIKKKLILTENKYIKDSIEAPEIYKYQSAENIIREVVSLYEAEKSAMDEILNWRGRKKVIGIYTPVGGARKTSFALALGQALSKQEAVLYMNLEGFSGLETILGRVWKSGLGDLLYYLQRKDIPPASKLPSVTENIQNMDIIPPVQYPDDLKSVKATEWIELFSNIMSETAYDTLILDVGNEIEEIGAILDFCTKVYVPVREDPLSNAKVRSFEAYLKHRMSDTGKVQMLKIPFNTASSLGKEYCDGLVWSELGDYVRNLIKEEHTN